MATNFNDPAYRKVEVHEFLAMDLGDAKAELVDGTILMMAGGSPKHAAVAANIINCTRIPFAWLRMSPLWFRYAAADCHIFDPFS